MTDISRRDQALEHGSNRRSNPLAQFRVVTSDSWLLLHHHHPLVHSFILFIHYTTTTSVDPCQTLLSFDPATLSKSILLQNTRCLRSTSSSPALPATTSTSKSSFPATPSTRALPHSPAFTASSCRPSSRMKSATLTMTSLLPSAMAPPRRARHHPLSSHRLYW